MLYLHWTNAQYTYRRQLIDLNAQNTIFRPTTFTQSMQAQSLGGRSHAYQTNTYAGARPIWPKPKTLEAANSCFCGYHRYTSKVSHFTLQLVASSLTTSSFTEQVSSRTVIRDADEHFNYTVTVANPRVSPNHFFTEFLWNWQRSETKCSSH